MPQRSSGRLKDEMPGARIWGIGGPAMQREGFQPIMPFAPFNRMGFLEVVLHLRFFLRARCGYKNDDGGKAGCPDMRGLLRL